ncbi:MAG: hypothetical protein ACRDZ4_13125 [Egibacteraceae bacterium]
MGVAVGADGTLYIADHDNDHVRKVTARARSPRSLAPAPQDSPVTAAPPPQPTLYDPDDVAVAADGSLYIADYDNSCVRKVDPSGTITTVAGEG